MFKLLNIYLLIYTFFFYLHSKFFITNRPGWRYTRQDKLDNAIPKKSKILSDTTQQRFILIHKISTVGSGDCPGTLISMQRLSHPVSWMIHFIWGHSLSVTSVGKKSYYCNDIAWAWEWHTPCLLVAHWPEVVTWQQEQDGTLLHTQRV